MKKIFLLILTLISTLVFWVIEPFAYNPFYPLDAPLVTSSMSYGCKPENKLQAAADLILMQNMQSNQFLGINVAASKVGCGTYIASSGYRDKRNVLTVNDNTLNRIASITKPMTAVAIMQLYEKGLINLDAPIQLHLPNFPIYLDTPITIRHLLNHTSGIAHYQSKLDAISFSTYSTVMDAVDAVAKKGLIAEPGKQYVYSSFGYTVLGAIVERVSKQSFELYMKTNIWEKADMHNTSIERRNTLANKSRLYLKVGSLFIRSPYTDLSIIYPAGGVQSTVEDLLLFGHAILNNQLITEQSLDIMTNVKHSLSSFAGDDPYGLGWYVYHDEKHGKRIAHSGAQPGSSAYFEINLNKKTVVVALSNAFGTKTSTYNLAKEIEKLVF